MPWVVLKHIAGKLPPPAVLAVLTAAQALPQILHQCQFVLPLAEPRALCFEMHLALLAPMHSSVSTSSGFSLSFQHAMDFHPEPPDSSRPLKTNIHKVEM